MPWTALVAALLLAASARAEEPLERARSLATEAQTEYDLGHYEAALKSFEELYKIKPVAGVLFNVAQCHRKLGQLKEAANLYRSFLVHADPESREAAKAQELLAQVEETIRQQEAVAKAAPQGTAPLPAAPKPEPAAWPPPKPVPAAAAPIVIYQPAPAPPPSHKAAWVLGGTAVAALAAGAVFGLSAKNAASSMTSGIHDNASVNDLEHTHDKNAHIADLFFAGAGVLALATVIAW